MSSPGPAASAAGPWLAPEQRDIFFRGLDAVLQQWTALNLVMQHTDVAAGPQMRQELMAWYSPDCSEAPPFADELEDYFFEFFDTRHRWVSIEDGSEGEVARCLTLMYDQCGQSNYASVDQFLQSLPVYKATTLTQCTWGGDPGDTAVSDDDDEGGDEAGGDDAGVVVPPPALPLMTPSLSNGDHACVDSAPVPEQATRQPLPTAAPPVAAVARGSNPYVASAGGWKTVQRRR